MAEGDDSNNIDLEEKAVEHEAVKNGSDNDGDTSDNNNNSDMFHSDDNNSDDTPSDRDIEELENRLAERLALKQKLEEKKL